MAAPTSSSSEPLNDALIRDSLSCLGRHPFAANHAYLAFKAPGKNIGDISALTNFPNLMYINLAENSVEDLSPLASIPGLAELDVSKNKLRSCLDFAPKRCTTATAWSTGQKAVGSMLTVADVSENCIANMDDLTPHQFLECLMLRGNIISKISGLQNLRYLQVLDLSYNRINRIEGLNGLYIMELNLEGNFLIDLNGLQGLSRLSVLNIANNRIRSLGPLSECAALHNVDVRNNEIAIIRNVEFLSELSFFRYLDLTGNPCCEKQFYRNRVVYRVPHLQVLDGTTVSAEEKVRCRYRLFFKYLSLSGSRDRIV